MSDSAHLLHVCLAPALVMSSSMFSRVLACPSLHQGYRQAPLRASSPQIPLLATAMHLQQGTAHSATAKDTHIPIYPDMSHTATPDWHGYYVAHLMGPDSPKRLVLARKLTNYFDPPHQGTIRCRKQGRLVRGDATLSCSACSCLSFSRVAASTHIIAN